MTAMANIGNLVVALPPADIWLTDEQAADFLGYAGTYFKASIICLKGFPKPRYITDNSKGRRCGELFMNAEERITQDELEVNWYEGCDV